jgi:hypothetical protein
MFTCKSIFSLACFCTCFLLLCTINTYAQFGTGTSWRSGARQAAQMQQDYLNGRANGKKMRGYLGYDIGAFFAFADKSFSYTYDQVDASGINRGEIAYSKKLKSRALGFYAGSYTPLGNISSSSCLAFDFAAAVTLIHDKTDKFVVTTPWSISNYKSNIIYWQFAIPLCLDFKYGGEAIYDKAEAFSLTLGAGFQPSLASGAMLKTAKLIGAVSPMIKAEIGFFAGLQWKVKASYIYQSGVIYKAQKGDPGMEAHPDSAVMTMTTKPVLNIGVSFMPFSHDWDSSVW